MEGGGREEGKESVGRGEGGRKEDVGGEEGTKVEAKREERKKR